MIPPGPSVAVAGLMLMGASVKLAVPRVAVVTASEAVTTTVCWDTMLFGAVYSPLVLMLPSAGLSFQVTLPPEGRFATTNCRVSEGARGALVAGVTTGVAGAGDGLDGPLLGGREGTGAGDGGPGNVFGGPATVVISGSSKMVALALLVGSAALVAEIVTNVSTLTGLTAE